MKGILAGILALLAIYASATPVTVADLNCGTDFLVQGSLMDDLVPAKEMTERRVTILFQLSDTDLADEVYIEILTDTITIQAYQDDGTYTGGERVWADIQNAILTQPGALPACLLVPGCDGFIVDSPLLVAHFPRNATKLVFSAQVQYAANFTSSVFQSTTPAVAAVTMGVGARRRLLAVTPDNATVIGDSDVVSVDLTFTDAIHNAAFNPASSSDDAVVIGASVGGSVGFLLLVCLLYAAWRSTNASDGYGRSSEERKSLNMSTRGSRAREDLLARD